RCVRSQTDAPCALHSLSLHDALPIFDAEAERPAGVDLGIDPALLEHAGVDHAGAAELDPTGLLAQTAAAAELDALAGLTTKRALDRKSTRLNSSHVKTSNAVLRQQKK